MTKISKLDQVLPMHRIWAMCELVCPKKQRNSCSELLAQQLIKQILKTKKQKQNKKNMLYLT